MLAALFREGVNDIEVGGVLIEEVPILEVETTSLIQPRFTMLQCVYMLVFVLAVANSLCLSPVGTGEQYSWLKHVFKSIWRNAALSSCSWLKF
ncbi:hypothetical protein RHMOL_Rhmol02G0164000 [Rhododendron molle]|uniref:Uncharacterized protein n=1 Tax=Rhododendron molle TaxID=49168 RepID=A0ACC0PQI2_RHOML|nr:hypothetical protein RHMOL_Rhmol02G0164000 [Rhododendron molle]